LSQVEARDALARVGPNETPRAARRNLLNIMQETLREPMFLLLIGAGLQTPGARLEGQPAAHERPLRQSRR
jgi:hypothetical protein